MFRSVIKAAASAATIMSFGQVVADDSVKDIQGAWQGDIHTLNRPALSVGLEVAETGSADECASLEETFSSVTQEKVTKWLIHNSTLASSPQQ